MKTHILLSLIFLFGILSGCAEHSSLQDTLDKAENFMENHPDSAYSLLQTVDSDALRTRGGRARYALLYTQAQDKNYIDETNDSLISVATNYYQHHGDVRNRFLSLYYKGRVSYNAGDYLHAMLNYSEAETLVPDLQDDYYAGLLYSQLGDLYMSYYDFPKSLKAYQKAEVCYRNAGRDYHRLFAMTDQSVILRSLNEYAKSDSLLQTVLIEANRIENHTLMDYTLSSLLMQYVEQGRMQEAEGIYERLVNQYGIENNSSSFMSSVIQIFISNNEIDKAKTVLQKAWIQAKTVDDSISCHLSASRIYKSLCQFDSAMIEHEAGILMQNRIITKNLEQPILTMQRDYLSQELKYEAYKRKMNRIVYMFVILIICILVLVGGYFLFKRLRKHYRRSLHRRLQQQEVENRCKIDHLWQETVRREETIRQSLMKLSEEAKQKNETSLQRIFELQEELRLRDDSFHSYRQQTKEFITTLGETNRQQKEQCVLLCRTYFNTIDKIYTIYNSEYVNSAERNKAIDDMLLMFVDKYTKGKKAYAMLENIVNENMDNAMTHLRTEVELFDEKYYQQICFQFAGFSGDAIALFMNTTPNTIYKRKKRIIEKIEKEQPIHQRMYIELLSK